MNVLRVVTAFERRRIVTMRADDVATACEQLVLVMPHVVLVLVPPENDAQRDALDERAVAVGAFVVHVDPHLDEQRFQEILDDTVQTALQKKLLREAAEVQERAVGGAELLSNEDLDDGWDG